MAAPAPRLLQHLGRDVHGNHEPRRPHRLAKEWVCPSRAAGYIQYAPAGWGSQLADSLLVGRLIIGKARFPASCADGEERLDLAQPFLIP